MWIGTFDFATKLKNSHPEMLKAFADFLMTVLLINNFISSIKDVCTQIDEKVRSNVFTYFQISYVSAVTQRKMNEN